MQQWLSLYLDRRSLALLPLGFAAGLPLMLVLATLHYWLREAGVSLSTIGFFSWAGLAYALKWLWAPLIDGLKLPLLHALLGRRRSWLLLSQAGIIGCLLLLSGIDPQADNQLELFALCAVLVAFCSATQDIVIDAYRIESAPESMQGALAATYTLGYRLAMITASAGSLALAAWLASDESYHATVWQTTYKVMAALMLMGPVTTLCLKEPEISSPQQSIADRQLLPWLKNHVIAPFSEFFQRFGGLALMILALIACYRIADVVMGIMATPFYVDMGFTKAQVATISKVYGLLMTLLGTLLGGILVSRFGTTRTLLLGAVLTAVTNLLFSWLAQLGEPNVTALTLIIAADNLSAGIASAAFIAYLSGLTNVAYSATQYALFSALMLLLPKLLAGWSGVVVEQIGYSLFFASTALLGLPVVILIWLVNRQFPASKTTPTNGDHRVVQDA